jgi:hypothetical protein
MSRFATSSWGTSGKHIDSIQLLGDHDHFGETRRLAVLITKLSVAHRIDDALDEAIQFVNRHMRGNAFGEVNSLLNQLDVFGLDPSISVGLLGFLKLGRSNIKAYDAFVKSVVNCLETQKHPDVEYVKATFQK